MSLALIVSAAVLGAGLFVIQDQTDVLDGTPVAAVAAAAIALLGLAASLSRLGLRRTVVILALLTVAAVIGFWIALGLAFQDG